MRSIVLGIGSVALVAVVGLASCSSDGASSGSTDGSSPDSSATIITVGPTAFATVAPTVAPTLETTTTLVVIAPGTVIPTESTYTVQSGDYPSTVASKFKVDLQALLDLNGFELVNDMVPSWPQPGTVIKIPAGATMPNEDGSPGTDVPTGTDGTGGAGATTVAPVTTVDVCAESEYVIQAGDAPSTVAAKFDTTVDALAAANVNTNGYDNFVVGITIKIPAKTDC